MTHFNNQKWWPLKSGCHSKEATFHEKNLVENIMRSEGGSDILSGTPCPMSCALSSYTEKKKWAETFPKRFNLILWQRCKFCSHCTRDFASLIHNISLRIIYSTNIVRSTFILNENGAKFLSTLLIPKNGNASATMSLSRRHVVTK